MQPHSGGSGIRTHVGVTQTCFQDMRLQPLGHPSLILTLVFLSVILRRRTSFYHKEIENQCIGAHIALIQNTCICEINRLRGY